MMEFPRCYWQIIDDRRGTCVFAGFFRMGDAVSEGLSMIRSGGWVGSITVEPWFQSRAEEFEFWAQWWALEDISSGRWLRLSIERQEKRRARISALIADLDVTKRS